MQDLHDHFRDRNIEARYSGALRKSLVADTDNDTIVDRKTGETWTPGQSIERYGQEFDFDRLFYFLTNKEWPDGILIHDPLGLPGTQRTDDLFLFYIPRIPLFDLAYADTVIEHQPNWCEYIKANCRVREDGRIWVRDDPHGHRAHDWYVKINGVMFSAARVTWFLETGSWPKHTIRFIDGDVVNRRITNMQDINRDDLDQRPRQWRHHERIYRMFRLLQKRRVIK
jgi:hypothetical protein